MIATRLASRNSLVIEVASNDGYLLRNFVEAGIPCFGSSRPRVRPRGRRSFGIPVQRDIFGVALATPRG